LNAPTEHAQTLVSPRADRLHVIVESNRTLFQSYDFLVDGKPFRDVREFVRRQVVGECASANVPIIATGHQPDFFHAGVWAKHIVADRLAKAVGGCAADLVVDHDAPKQTVLMVPTIRDGRPHLVRVEYAEHGFHEAFEFLPASTTSQAANLVSELRDALGSGFDSSMLPTFAQAYQGGHHATWVDQAITARKAIEEQMGIRLIQRRTSDIWYGPFLGALLHGAEAFADAHNRALIDYQRAQGIKSPDRPVARLQSVDGAVETAMWIYRPGQARCRLFVANEKDGMKLFADGELVSRIPLARSQHCSTLAEELDQIKPWVIRPRALTLTMWARLFWADLFIHGIGGAKYDRITDRLIRNFFGVEPPAMACVSATLHMPLPRSGTDLAELSASDRCLRDIAFNPQRYVKHPAMASLVEQKEKLIAESKRLRAERNPSRRAREQIFADIRSLNDAINALQPSRRTEMQTARDQLESAIAADRIANRREFFFAMHPRSDLQLLLDRLPSVQQMRPSDIV